MWAILAMLTLWVMIHTVRFQTIVPDFSSTDRTINILLERVKDVETKMLNLENQDAVNEYEAIYQKQWEKEELLANGGNTINSFGEKFNEMRYMYGPGAIFSWNGDKYTTYYKEEIINKQ